MQVSNAQQFLHKEMRNAIFALNFFPFPCFVFMSSLLLAITWCAAAQEQQRGKQRGNAFAEDSNNSCTYIQTINHPDNWGVHPAKIKEITLLRSFHGNL